MTFDEAIDDIIVSADRHKADMEAIRHELEAVWEAINELQGIDPERAGEPNE